MAPHDADVANSGGNTATRANSARRPLPSQSTSHSTVKPREASTANRNDSLTLSLAASLPRNYVKLAKKARPSGRVTPSTASFARWKQPSDLAGDRMHAVAQLLPAVARLEQLVGNLERRQ